MYLSKNKNKSIPDLLFEELKKPLPGLAAQRLMLPVTRQENRSVVPENAKKSAILILLYERKGHFTICLIKRTIDASAHSGQISFPGGKKENTDKDLIYTALRETEEEIGAKTDQRMVLGLLSTLYIPVSNYIVLPVVAFSHKGPVFNINKLEVEELIEVSISHLLKPDTCKMDKIKVRDSEYEVPVYRVGDHKIWGATAMIMSEFLEIYKKINGKI
jgi:8-oxo-dGTP pyrophosphatase MutT (NUDIX family)